MSDQGQMRRVRSGDHLTQIGDIWYYLRVVPPAARDVFGKTKVKKSLGTSSHTEAKRLEKIEDVEFEEKLQRARQTGPDGLPRDNLERASRFALEIVERNELSADELERALKRYPKEDRELVRDTIEYMGAEEDHADADVDQFLEELRDVVFAARLDTGDWSIKRREIVALIEDHQKHSVTEHTLDWAYVEWTKAGKRPQQTLDEASRYLDDFKHSANVRSLSGVRRAHLLSWRGELEDRGTPEAASKELRDSRKLSNKSINHRLEIVSAILRSGWRDAEMPAPDLSKINLHEGSSNDRGAWSKEALLTALGELEPGSGEAWLFAIGLTTGTRIGETVAARKEWYKPLGFIEVPPEYTKMKKPHVLPIIELLRWPLVQHLGRVKDGEFIFHVPRPSNPKLKMSHEVSKWFSRFYHRHSIFQVTHELRDTWIEAARHNEVVKKEIYEIITGHSAKTGSDGYGGERPSVLMDANEKICRDLLDDDLRAAVLRLVA